MVNSFYFLFILEIPFFADIPKLRFPSLFHSRSTSLINFSLTKNSHAKLIKEDWDNWRMHLLLKIWALYRSESWCMRTGKGGKHFSGNQCLSMDINFSSFLALFPLPSSLSPYLLLDHTC